MCFERVISPLTDYGIHEATRLVVHNNQTKQFALIQELAAGASHVLRYADLEPHLDYTFKLQIKCERKWIDHRGYERVMVESISSEGIKYLLYPDKSSRHLVVVFQAINHEPGYNYIGTLRHLKVNKLFIKDDYGDDPATRSSYYLGKNRSFDIANATQKLLLKVMQELGVARSDCIFCGSSKGGFAAIYHGYTFGAGFVRAGGPQILLGNFLNSKSEKSVHIPILRYLAGDDSNESVDWANGLLEQALSTVLPPYPNTIIHVGKKEPHYENHAIPFLDMCRHLDIGNVKVEIGDYSTHAELATHFPIFLSNQIESILESKKTQFDDLSSSIKSKDCDVENIITKKTSRKKNNSRRNKRT